LFYIQHLVVAESGRGMYPHAQGLESMKSGED
jgi:hypothetical protein